MEGADVVMGLRIQLERQQAGNFPSLNEYAEFYGVNEKVLSLGFAGRDRHAPRPRKPRRGADERGDRRREKPYRGSGAVGRGGENGAFVPVGTIQKIG